MNILPSSVSVLALVFPLIFLSGCATAPPLQTKSGRPEVTIHNRTAVRVKSVVVNYFVDQGWSVAREEGTQLIFEHQGTAGESLLMGMLTDNPQSTNRITITLIENGSDVRVVGGIAAVGSNNFNRQQAVELTGKGYPSLQSSLEQIKSKAESGS